MRFVRLPLDGFHTNLHCLSVFELSETTVDFRLRYAVFLFYGPILGTVPHLSLYYVMEVRGVEGLFWGIKRLLGVYYPVRDPQRSYVVLHSRIVRM